MVLRARKSRQMWVRLDESLILGKSGLLYYLPLPFEYRLVNELSPAEKARLHAPARGLLVGRGLLE